MSNKKKLNAAVKRLKTINNDDIIFTLTDMLLEGFAIHLEIDFDGNLLELNATRCPVHQADVNININTDFILTN
jgi:hypothetical protein